jgi:5-formyltetrahydrofolate cyclo-ligase
MVAAGASVTHDEDSDRHVAGPVGPGGDPPEPTAPKAAWRRWARAERRALAADREAWSAAEAASAAHLAAFGPWREARVALVYLAFRDEPDPLAALPTEAIPARLATTRTPPDGADLTLHALEPGALETHPLGFRQPCADAPLVTPREVDVVLVPGLVFDRRGARLGYGRGYYDRLLATLPASVTTIGVTRSALVVPRLPETDRDVRVAWLLTEDGLRRVAAD